jgi:DNA-binding transcriptional LysR family regulator
VTVADGYSATFIDWVAGGQLDAALINKPRARLSLDAQPLLDEEMVLVTSAEHGPELPHAIELAQLPELELVLPTKRHGLRGVLDTAAQHEDVLLAPRFEIDVLSTIVKLVESTHFATILPRIAVQRGVRQGSLRAYPILAPRIVRHIVCVTHPRRPLSAAADALVSIIADELRQVSSASELDATLSPPSGDASSEPPPALSARKPPALSSGKH